MEFQSSVFDSLSAGRNDQTIYDQQQRQQQQSQQLLEHNLKTMYEHTQNTTTATATATATTKLFPSKNKTSKGAATANRT